ncbi:MAG: hypothetical protein WD595_06865 [Waddliaceae bacterium]
MSDISSFPHIEMMVHGSESQSQISSYQAFVEETLSRMVPDGNIEKAAPFVSCTLSESSTFCSFFFLARYRSDSFKFFFDLVSRWSIPGSRLDVIFIHASDFRLKGGTDQVYTICEVKVRLSNIQEWGQIKRNWSNLKSELLLGIESSFYARKIQQVRGLSNSEKTAAIQEHITYLLKRYPKHFTKKLFSEMHNLLILCRDEFKSCRSISTLVRIITCNYLFGNEILKAIQSHPNKRHVRIKLNRSKLFMPEMQKNVLSVLVSLNLLEKKEFLEESHLIKAIQKFIPNSVGVPDSFFQHRRINEKMCHLYLEIEKTDGSFITPDELSLLKAELPIELEGRIEHPMSPVFMPRNEEEIMRNVLELSKQIKYVRDIPQCWMTFEEQTHSHLFFTIIILRVLKRGTAPIDSLIQHSNSNFELIYEWSRTVGSLRKKYPKEATVIRLKLPKEKFLRANHSINLYRARFEAVLTLTQVIGEFRDYNGGMIFKQNQLLSHVRELLDQSVKYNELLLETFFYSIKPPIMRSVLEPEALKTLFYMVQNAVSNQLHEKEAVSYSTDVDLHFVYAVVISHQKDVIQYMRKLFKKLKIESTELAYSTVNIYGTFYTGYLYRTDNPEKQELFCDLLKDAIEEINLSH